jgi:pilus assembly protein CpaF
MEMMVNLANPNVSLAATREQVAAAIDVFVHLARLSDGTRRVMQITEALGIEDGDIALQDIFIFEKVGISPDNRVQGRFHATGIQPTFLHALRRCELFLPDSLFHSVVEV